MASGDGGLCLTQRLRSTTALVCCKALFTLLEGLRCLMQILKR